MSRRRGVQKSSDPAVTVERGEQVDVGGLGPTDGSTFRQSEQLFDPTHTPVVTPQGTVSREEKQRLRPDLDRVVRKIFKDDPIDEEYDRLEEALRLGEKRNEPAFLLEALDNAEDHLLKAARLHARARVERERWEIENAPVTGSMRSEATRSLQEEKANGERAKQITDADVVARIKLMFPDEWSEQEIRRLQIEKTVSLIGTLQEAWVSRCRSLQTMVSKSR